MGSQNNWNEPVMNEDVVAAGKGEVLPISKDKLLQIDVRVVDVLSNYMVPGVLVGFTPGEVAILLNEPMSEQRTVAVHLNSFSFEGQILYCGPHAGQYEVHVSIDDIEGTGLRKAPRFPVTIPAELMRPNGDPVPITICDISRDGMGVESPLELEIGRPVAVATGPAFVFAVVRYCRPTPSGLFHAGMEMHHLFERTEPPTAPPAPSILRELRIRFSRRSKIADCKPVRVTQ
jgi:hypothetical protein